MRSLILTALYARRRFRFVLLRGADMSRWVVPILFSLAVAFAGCSGPQGPQGAQGAKGDKGDPGQPASGLHFRVVTGNPSVSCGDDETLVSVVCSVGAPDGSKCTSDAVGLCVQK
jgi:hypothetical protein